MLYFCRNKQKATQNKMMNAEMQSNQHLLFQLKFDIFPLKSLSNTNSLISVSSQVLHHH